MTIGERAARAIKSRAPTPKQVDVELAKLDIPRSTYNRWIHGKCDPTAYYLRQMALAGYDIYYVLTGKENFYAED